MPLFTLTPPIGFVALGPGVIWNSADLSSITLSGGNLTAVGTAQGAVRATQSYSFGKYYWEVSSISTEANANTGIGIANGSAVLGTVASAPTNAAICYRSGNIWVNNASTGITDGVFGAGGPSINGIAVDFGAHLIWFCNSSAPTSWNGSTSNNPATGVGGVSFSVITGPYFPIFTCGVSADQCTVNFSGSAAADVTKIAIEEWGGVGSAQLTKIAVEEWASLSTSAGQALVSQIAVEEWASVIGPTLPFEARVQIMI